MSYEYKPSKAELRAAALLQSKGWSVHQPACPRCHGTGFMTVSSAPLSESRFGSYTIGMEACPNGCQVAYFFQSSTTDTVDVPHRFQSIDGGRAE